MDMVFWLRASLTIAAACLALLAALWPFAPPRAHVFDIFSTGNHGVEFVRWQSDTLRAEPLFGEPGHWVRRRTGQKYLGSMHTVTPPKLWIAAD